MKAVFDTNVYLAAALHKQYAWEQLIRSAPSGPYQVFVSPEIILELREKLEGRFEWPSANSSAFINQVMTYVDLVYPARRIAGVLQDTDDHIILECAAEAKAQAIFTSDKGLLRLKEFEGIAIVHPTMLQYLK